MKLTRDLVVIAVLCAGFYGWKHRLIPKPKPLFPGKAPVLAMPSPSDRPLRPDADEAMLVEKESLGMPDKHLNGRHGKPKPLGETPQLLTSAVLPSLEPAASPLEADKPTWLDKAATPQGMVAVVALFALCYLVLGRALRRGPGGRGLTHD